MLPKQHRLQNYQEIEEVKKKGKLYQTPLFGLLVLSRAEGTCPEPLGPELVAEGLVEGSSTRFAFIVSTKLSQKAVQRNRVKRLLSEAVRNFLPQVLLGFDLVFLAKKTIIDKSFREIKSQVEIVLRKAKLIK